ncbi:hypothetical protein T07_8026 [Trichinella nelsoni]|uniref:Uncharacterized protein n=1 Tax=Trichinella nelsoni TaxID=6336 RepID=A0A0V0RPE4_9BILA|nr:hypothetical protein T07_8026 [Trichinella nelsoni]
MTRKLKKKLLRNFTEISSPSLEEGRQHSGEQLPARSEAAQFGSEEYSAVIWSYLDNGWAKEAPDTGPLGRTGYPPHHAVYKKGSTGEVTCRVSFDGSALFRDIALNHPLDSRAKLQAKMYMQVALHEADRDVCRFLWKEPGKDEPLKAYSLT